MASHFSGAVWEWSEPAYSGVRWDRYEPAVMAQLEQEYQKDKTQTSVRLTTGYFATRPEYSINFRDMIQLNQKTTFSREIRRIDPSKKTKKKKKKTTEAKDKKESVSTSPVAPLPKPSLDEFFVQVDLKTLPTDGTCSICMETFSASSQASKLSKCTGHWFHRACIEPWLEMKRHCPSCKARYGVMTGNQPEGQMNVRYESTSLDGYNGCGTIVITYQFPRGKQGPEHPAPGFSYPADSRAAYLPNNPAGQQVLALLQKAWERRLIFTIGQSITRGADNVIIWNGIHHKTSPDGGPSNFGYPDPTYLQRVTDELKLKGVSKDD